MFYICHNLVSFFILHMYDLVTALFIEVYPLPINLQYPSCHKSSLHICMGLCMGFLSCSSGLFVCIYTHTLTSLCLTYYTFITDLALSNTRQPFSPALLLPRKVLVHFDPSLFQTTEELACELELSFLCGCIYVSSFVFHMYPIVPPCINMHLLILLGRQRVPV